MLWWSSGTSWFLGPEHSTVWSPAWWWFDPRLSRSHDSSRKSALWVGRSSCPSPAPQSWFQSLLGGSHCVVVSPQRGAGTSRWQKETRVWLLLHGGGGGQDHKAGHGGKGRASCLVRWRDTGRWDSAPGAEKGPQPQRAAGSDPSCRWSIHLSSSLMEPLLPEEAAELKWEWTAGRRS